MTTCLQTLQQFTNKIIFTQHFIYFEPSRNSINFTKYFTQLYNTLFYNTFTTCTTESTTYFTNLSRTFQHFTKHLNTLHKLYKFNFQLAHNFPTFSNYTHLDIALQDTIHIFSNKALYNTSQTTTFTTLPHFFTTSQQYTQLYTSLHKSNFLFAKTSCTTLVQTNHRSLQHSTEQYTILRNSTTHNTPCALKHFTLLVQQQKLTT